MSRKLLTVATVLTLTGVLTAGCGASSSGSQGSTKKPAADPSSLSVGAAGPGGGMVVHVDPAGFPCGEDLQETCTYIEVSPAQAQAERQWSLDDKSAVGVGAPPESGERTKHHGIGAGEYNSTIIAAFPGAGDESNNAAIYALGYETPAADDWYLPSIDELSLIYDNRATLDGIVEDSYWSSTEGSPIDAWGIYFAKGLKSTNFKWRVQTYHVRPVRAG